MDKYWWEGEGWPSDLAPFVIMMRAFIDGRLSAPEFETLYLVAFKGDQRQHSTGAFDLLETMFFDVDSYHHDATIREATEGIDENELQARAIRVIGGLETFKR